MSHSLQVGVVLTCLDQLTILYAGYPTNLYEWIKNPTLPAVFILSPVRLSGTANSPNSRPSLFDWNFQDAQGVRVVLPDSFGKGLLGW